MKNNYVLGGSASCFDLFNLERQFAGIEEAPVDFVHFDVVDGRFNQCIILGLPTLQAIRPHTKLPIEVHLAVYEPELYIKQFVDAGADIVTIPLAAVAGRQKLVPADHELLRIGREIGVCFGS